ncbi:MAG: arsenosugar biosynthesis radical SAM protein ArsS, partial [Acidobacteria bacterium]|nr:arsenosugar biosynthesis radical SAM protein ArsS [Acidobacteriota bacterium]
MSAAIYVQESTSPLTPASSTAPTFAATLAGHGLWPLVRQRVTTLQVNVGRLCNLACHHCHVEAGPKRSEILAHDVAERVIELLDVSPDVQVLDLTGGAPEMNPSFRFLVTEARRRGRQVIDRCNLTIFLEDGYRDLPQFLAAHEVRIVASLPCYQKENVDKQRGRGVFDGSIEMLRQLNALGYGRPSSPLRLDLVYNPLGASLPPPQAELEGQYRHELAHLFGIEFHRLLTITNMPIKRFGALLARTNQQEAYMGLLVNHFNPTTVPELMCRSLVSVGWEGQLYDCDFNQMLEIPLGAAAAIGTRTIWDSDSFDALERQRIATGKHCFGCTAGSG